MTNKVRIFNIERFAIHDGPGIRTVVFLKGCPLHCPWCANPESKPMEPVVLHTKQGDKIAGKDMTIDEVMQVIVCDKDYYDRSGGGVTFSGGEALIYPDFLQKILSMCKQDKIHTAIETSLYAPFENIEKIADLIDLFIVDIKLFDSDKHKEFTGVKNELILQNLEKLSKIHSNLWIRIPLIPDVNDDEQNLENTARFIKSLGGCVKKVELLKYNNLAPSKYRALGIYDGIFEAKPQTNEQMKQKASILKNILGDIVSHE